MTNAITKKLIKNFLKEKLRCKKKINKITRKSKSKNDHGQHNIMDYPKEIMMNIMSKLSISTYFRIGLACIKNEEFCHTISDPYFARSHGVSTHADSCASLLAADRHATRSNFFIEYCVNDNTTTITPFSFDFIKDLGNHTTLFEILVSYRGWLLVRLNPYYYVSNRCSGDEPLLRLVNPMTRQCLVLPKPIRKGTTTFNNNIQHYRFHDKYLMGCSPTTGQYKVVRISLCNCEGKGSYAQVRSLCNKPNNKARWRKIKIDGHIQRILQGANCFVGDQVELHGALNWFINSEHKILRFDIDKEEFDVMSSPNNKDMLAKSLSLLGGSLCVTLFTTGYRARNEIWVMKEYGVHESWTKLNEISEHQNGRIIQILEDGEKLITLNSHNYGLSAYDRESKEGITQP